MGKMMLVCVLLSALLPLTTTEVLTPKVQWITQQPNEGTREETSETSNQVHTATAMSPTAKAVENVNSFMTLSTLQYIAHLEATTIYATTEVQTSPVYNKIATSSKDLATSTVRNAEISTPAHDSTSSATSSMISSTSSGFMSTVQANTMSTESAKVVVPTERTSTRVVPTAMLSATTQLLPSIPNATAKLATTTKSVSTTTQHPTPSVQNTTMKLAQTTRKPPPAVVTKGHEKTSSNTGTDDDAKKSVKHGKIVAGLIGGALIVMMIGFLVILYKKHKLKKHQIASTDWAGPTPFLETGGDSRDNGHVTLRSANRISLASFLPQRFSKRMSLLAETAEEMQDMQEMTTGTTFVAKEEQNGTGLNQSSKTSGKEANENYSESSGKTEEVVLVDETKEAEGETGEEKPNGEAAINDGENGQLQNTPEDDAPNEPKDENKEMIENDDGGNVA